MLFGSSFIAQNMNYEKKKEIFHELIGQLRSDRNEQNFFLIA